MSLSPPRNFETRVETFGMMLERMEDVAKKSRCVFIGPVLFWLFLVVCHQGREFFFRVKFKSKGQYQHAKRNRPRHCLVRASQISLVIVNATKK